MVKTQPKNKGKIIYIGIDTDLISQKFYIFTSKKEAKEDTHRLYTRLYKCRRID